MKTFYALAAVATLAAATLANTAQAALVLDTGTPSGSGFPLSLDGTDYVAAEFSLGAAQTITSLQGYITAGISNPGDTFTVALYSGSTAPGSTPIWSGQATYQADGWNGLTSLHLSGLAAGNYWVAFEVGALDSAAGLALPIGAPNSGATPALAYAFSSGGAYQAMSGFDFGAQVSTLSAVPLPGALVLLMSGLVSLGGLRRKHLSP
jgi:hypothetical protein